MTYYYWHGKGTYHMCAMYKLHAYLLLLSWLSPPVFLSFPFNIDRYFPAETLSQ